MKKLYLGFLLVVSSSVSHSFSLHLQDIIAYKIYQDISLKDFSVAVSDKAKTISSYMGKLYYFLKDSKLNRTSYHEAGHTLMAKYYGFKIVKVTAIPSGELAGYTYFEYYPKNMTDLKRISVLLAGKAAEVLYYDINVYSFGCRYDFEEAVDCALSYVRSICGCYLNSMDLSNYDSVPELPEIQLPKNISQEEKRKVNYILSKQYQEVKKIVEQQKVLLIKLAQALQAKKILYSQDVHNVYMSY